ncbi:MAG: Nif3-like dinuclear metal center hexameric protein [Chroococcidiopsidaceae cyanobacterium CP_BM_RX_35]|nr:Nif3-like dinuclear metal center hexameric protein [Chroococcidiopsidaceae cyanobacterium CP_BM_RX_35]
MIYLVDIAQFLDQFFAIHRYSEEPGGVYWSSTRPIRRFGVALEPWSQLADWAIAERLDGLFLHRPWKLQSNQLPPDIGVVAYHLPFDERLTLGFNPRLADVLGMSELEILGEKAGRAIGMIGEIPTQSFADYCCYLNEVFGGQDAAHAGGQNEIKRLAVVGAMTDALIRGAALRGADIYITGQLRQPALAVVLETGISVVEIGHRRCEEWGLRVLAGVLRERWAQLEVVIFH